MVAARTTDSPTHLSADQTAVNYLSSAYPRVAWVVAALSTSHPYSVRYRCPHSYSEVLHMSSASRRCRRIREPG